MIIAWLLFLDFLLLGLVLAVYLRRIYRERGQLQTKADKSMQLQQHMYQIQVLQEISERIGYSLEGNKIIEIVTNSIGNLLEYDTVSFMLYSHTDATIFKCHVHKEVNHRFIEQVKENMIRATETICQSENYNMKIDDRIGGSILNDELDVKVESYINIPVVINNELLGLINISSSRAGLYDWNHSAVLFTITNQASLAVMKLQTMLESEKGKLTGIIAAMTDGVLMVDLENQLQIYNPAVVDLLALPVGRDITMFDIIDALAGKVDLRTKIEESLAKSIPLTIQDLILKDKALEITITPVRDHTGQQPPQRPLRITT